MKLFIVPVTVGIIFIGCLVSIHQIYVAGPTKQAAAAKSRAAEARALADKAQADEKTAAYSVDLEKVKGDNNAHIIAATALADVARGRFQESGITTAHIVAVFFAAIILITWRLLHKAEKKVEKLEFILIAAGNPAAIELVKNSGITINQKLLQGRV